jgi:formylglycine-generating enzyme required for sulfatase activity
MLLMRLLCLLLLPLSLAALVAAPDTAPDHSEERILKLFLSEFIELTPGTGKFPASFTLGSTFAGAPPTEKPAVTIRFAAPFAMARYEVTQELWGVVQGKNPSRWRGPRNSVEMMTWQEATAFCQKVTTMLHTRKLLDAAHVIRLPSEAEWEYACRAGTTTRYSFGDDEKDLGQYAWFIGNSKGEDPPVGRKKPNPWGFYDMHGYIWEWCADSWSPTLKDTPTDGSPRILPDVTEHVIRGGSWADSAGHARSAFRSGAQAPVKNDRIGFRCVKAKKEIRK